MEVARTKQYPQNFPTDVVKVLDAMSFTKGDAIELLGSMGLRSQQYAGDYDGVEIVQLDYKDDATALNWLAKRFQEMMKELRGMKDVFVGDIKGGVVPEWRVFPPEAGVRTGKVEGYNAVSARKVVDTLVENGVVPKETGADLLRKLLPALTPEQFLQLKQECKFHIVRWSVADVLAGAKRLADGRTFTLQDAFSSPGITKLDTIALVQNSRYTDFSVIYQFKNRGRILNPEPIDFERAINESILTYKAEGHPFKVLKREFSLARFKGNEQEMERLSQILNSDLGRLYLVLSDIGTLITLLQEHSNVPMEKVRYEIDQFKSRLSNIYSLEAYLKGEHDLLGDLNSAVKIADKGTLAKRLEAIEARLLKYLEEATEAKLTGGSASYQPLVDIKDIPSIDKAGNAKVKYETAKGLEIKLRDLAHYYRYRKPALALGYRVLADDIWKQIPKDAPNPDPTKDDKAGDTRDLDIGHDTYAKENAKAVIKQDTSTPFKDAEALKAFIKNPVFHPWGAPDWNASPAKSKGVIPADKEYPYGNAYSTTIAPILSAIDDALQDKGKHKWKTFKDALFKDASQTTAVARFTEVAPWFKP